MESDKLKMPRLADFSLPDYYSVSERGREHLLRGSNCVWATSTAAHSQSTMTACTRAHRVSALLREGMLNYLSAGNSSPFYSFCKVLSMCLWRTDTPHCSSRRKTHRAALTRGLWVQGLSSRRLSCPPSSPGTPSFFTFTALSRIKELIC